MNVSATQGQAIGHDSSLEVVQLREQLKELIRHANNNQALSRRIQQFELRLLAAPSIGEMISMLINDFVEEFKLPGVGLLLHDQDYELAHILENAGAGNLTQLGLVLVTDKKKMPIKKLFKGKIAPLFSRKVDDSLAELIVGDHDKIDSILILPLERRDQLVGALILAGDKENRLGFNSDTELLERFTSILALAYENNLNLERLKQAGLIDALTSVNNRRFFEQRLLEEKERAMRQGSSLVCMMIDVDHFKSVNDEYGHEAGDKVLKQIAATLSQMMRRTDVLARYGGEEFVALLPDTGAEIAREVAERIRKRIEGLEVTINPKLTLVKTISIGLAVYEVGGEAVDSLISRADKALYRAKELGRNRVCIAPCRSAARRRPRRE